MTLLTEKCVACRSDSPRLAEGEIVDLMPQVVEWEVVEEEGVPHLVRSFKVRNFVRAQEFAVKVGEAAEGEGHHPRLTVEWGRITVAWWTHKIKGLHRNDFIMATKTDDIFREMSSSAPV